MHNTPEQVWIPRAALLLMVNQELEPTVALPFSTVASKVTLGIKLSGSQKGERERRRKVEGF